jgi:hypothetical protein
MVNVGEWRCEGVKPISLMVRDYEPFIFVSRQ